MQYGLINKYSMQTNYEDIDCGGGVHGPNYLKFFERARNFHLKEFGFPQTKLMSQKRAFVVAEAKIKYVKPALLEEAFVIASTISKANNLSILVEQAMFRTDASFDEVTFEKLSKSRDQKIICICSSRLIFFNLEKMRPVRMETELMYALKIPENYEELNIADTTIV